MSLKSVISLGKYAANTLTLLRLGAPILLFWPTFSLAESMWWFALLVSTDLFDGFVARMWNKHFGSVYGMSSPIGKVLDPAMDKYSIICAIVFIYLKRVVDRRIITVVITGEMLILMLCVGVIVVISMQVCKRRKMYCWNKGIYSMIFRAVKKELANIRVPLFGKIKTFAYFIAAIFVALYCMWPLEYLKNGFEIAFYCGIAFWLPSFIVYANQFHAWHENYKYVCSDEAE